MKMYCLKYTIPKFETFKREFTISHPLKFAHFANKMVIEVGRVVS